MAARSPARGAIGGSVISRRQDIRINIDGNNNNDNKNNNNKNQKNNNKNSNDKNRNNNKNNNNNDVVRSLAPPLNHKYQATS